MTMDEDTKVLRDYLMFTVPQVSVFAGAVFGVTLLLGLPARVAVGVFAALYGFMLLILAVIIRGQARGLFLYRVFVAFSLLLMGAGTVVLLEWVHAPG